MSGNENRLALRRGIAAFFLSFQFVPLSLAVAAPAALVAEWAALPITADGAGDEWAPAFGTLLKSESVQVAARSDSARLYLLVRFRSSAGRWAQPCAMTGLCAWIDAAGGTRKRLGFQLADGPEPPAGSRPGEEHRPARLDGRLRALSADTVALPPDGSGGPAAAFGCVGGVCTYEFSLPLDSTVDGFVGIGARPGSNVGIGLAAGFGGRAGAPRPQSDRADGVGGPGGPPRGGAGGRPGPGGAGEPRGDGGPDGRPRFSSPEFWLTTRLPVGPPPADEPKAEEP